jgi:hypothetical protein
MLLLIPSLLKAMPLFHKEIRKRPRVRSLTFLKTTLTPLVSTKSSRK